MSELSCIAARSPDTYIVIVLLLDGAMVAWEVVA